MQCSTSLGCHPKTLRCQNIDGNGPPCRARKSHNAYVEDLATEKKMLQFFPFLKKGYIGCCE